MVQLPGADPTWQIADIGDFNGDGKLDVLWHNRFTGDNGVWLMDGTVRDSMAQLPNTGWSWNIIPSWT